jgi:hypothetical protein
MPPGRPEKDGTKTTKIGRFPGFSDDESGLSNAVKKDYKMKELANRSPVTGEEEEHNLEIIACGWHLGLGTRRPSCLSLYLRGWNLLMSLFVVGSFYRFTGSTRVFGLFIPRFLHK